MAKYSLGKTTSVVQATVNKDVLFLDSAKADPIVEDMKAQFDTITRALNSISTNLNKAVKKKAVSGSYAKAFTGWAKKCSSQATAAGNRSKGLNSKYLADTQDYAMKLLSDKLTLFETKVNELEETNATLSSTNNDQAARIASLEKQVADLTAAFKK